MGGQLLVHVVEALEVVGRPASESRTALTACAESSASAAPRRPARVVGEAVTRTRSASSPASTRCDAA